MPQSTDPTPRLTTLIIHFLNPERRPTRILEVSSFTLREGCLVAYYHVDGQPVQRILPLYSIAEIEVNPPHARASRPTGVVRPGRTARDSVAASPAGDDDVYQDQAA